MEALTKKMRAASSLVDVGNLHAAAWEYRGALEAQQSIGLTIPSFDDNACEGWTQLSEDDQLGALRSFKKSSASALGNRDVIIAIGILERAVGDSYIGQQYLLNGLKRWPEDAILNKQMAENLIFQNRRVEAVEYFRKATQYNPSDVDLLFRFLWLLGELGEYDAIMTYGHLTSTIEDELMRRWVAGCIGHARIARSVDRDALRKAMLSQEKSFNWFSVEEVWAQIRSAIVDRRPYSLIRLGDGEARFLFRDDLHVGYSEIEREEFSDTAFLNWFDRASGTFSFSERENLRSMTYQSLVTADFLGLPMWERVSSDNIHFGYLWFLQDFIQKNVDLNRKNKTNCFVNVDIHKRSVLQQFNLWMKKIGLISCHQDLGGYLSKKLSIEVEATVIAGEKGQAGLPAMARAGVHYPDQFKLLLQRLSLIESGSVWLVAAGLLGKIYCSEIKRAGGIAIDVGSLVDAWMGHNTRGGHYEEKAAFSLKEEVRD